MQSYQNRHAIALVLTAILWPGIAMAQEGPSDLMTLDKGALRNEVQTRYDAALTLTRDAGVVSADNPRYLWASQAKAQCGIALGFLKSGTKDPVSVGKCADAYARMQMQGPAPMMAAPAAPATCNKGPFIVFFDWDRSDITAEAATVLDSAVSASAGCGASPVTVAGYADRSGSDSYNMGLSQRRADAVRNYFTARGASPELVTTQAFGETNPRVPTADGVRELQNRRVEISVQ